ncbi:TRAP-type mannitol/chloroaromatic compound transport system, small permease component [Puniceibacterium sp. IMCC21224]|nr:TRAP-type mannitol/chloroaromatic compound transport system, small permease component [Puniceibacterium sp. IMCC21224]
MRHHSIGEAMNFIISMRRSVTSMAKWAAILAGMVTFVIMWVIDINAFTRKLLNAPLPAGVEMTQALLPLAIMLPFAWALASNNHVSSGFLTSRLSPRANRYIRAFWMFVGFLLFAAVTYGTWQYAMRSYRMGEQAWGATLRFPIWPSKMAVSLGTALICLQFGVEALASLFGLDDKACKETPQHG